MGCTLVHPLMYRNLKRMFQETSLCKNDYKTAASGDYRKVLCDEYHPDSCIRSTV